MFVNTLKITWKVLVVLVAAGLIVGCSGDRTVAGDDVEIDDQPVVIQDQPGKLYHLSGVYNSPGLGGQGGPAKEAQHYWPMDFETVGDDVYVVDWNNHCVHLITPDGMMNRYIGSGFLGDDTDGPKELIDLNHPAGIMIGPDGNFWLSAWHNWKIKIIDPATGILSSPIGTGPGFEGDGGPAGSAKFNLLTEIVFDADNNIYVADQGNQRLRFIDLTTMIVTTVAGNGVQGFADGFGEDVMFNNPTGSDATAGMRMDIDDAKENIFIADKLNNRIRQYHIPTGEVTTIAGTGVQGYSGDGGLAVNAQLHWPTDIDYASDGRMFIADEQNHAVRVIYPNGTIETIVGNDEIGHSADGTDLADARLNSPNGVHYDEVKDILYIADTFNQQTRFILNP